MNWREEAKKKAALKATKHVKNDFILGLGSGSTIIYAIEEIGKKIVEENLNIMGVPTSYQSLNLAIKNKIPITTLDEHPELDVTIDGADQYDSKLNLIKGKGGALTREKIVALAANQFIVVVDETKSCKKLGINQHVPIEILPFSLPTVISKIKKLGGKAIIRESQSKVGPVITDNGNFIVDVNFGLIDDPKKLECKLKLIPGVIETGLFIEMTDIIYVGQKNFVQKLERVTKN